MASRNRVPRWDEAKSLYPPTQCIQKKQEPTQQKPPQQLSMKQPSTPRQSTPRLSTQQQSMQPQLVQPQASQQQPTQLLLERNIEESILRYDRIRRTAMNAIQSNCQIILLSQDATKTLNNSIRHQAQKPAADIENLKMQEKRRKLWRGLNEEKMEGCRRIIALMDKAEVELREVRARGGVKSIGLCCEIPRVERLAVGAAEKAEVGKKPTSI